MTWRTRIRSRMSPKAGRIRLRMKWRAARACQLAMVSRLSSGRVALDASHQIARDGLPVRHREQALHDGRALGVAAHQHALAAALDADGDDGGSLLVMEPAQ